MSAKRLRVLRKRHLLGFRREWFTSQHERHDWYRLESFFIDEFAAFGYEQVTA